MKLLSSFYLLPAFLFVKPPTHHAQMITPIETPTTDSLPNPCDAQLFIRHHLEKSPEYQSIQHKLKPIKSPGLGQDVFPFEEKEYEDKNYYYYYLKGVDEHGIFIEKFEKMPKKPGQLVQQYGGKTTKSPNMVILYNGTQPEKTHFVCGA